MTALARRLDRIEDFIDAHDPGPTCPGCGFPQSAVAAVPLRRATNPDFPRCETCRRVLHHGRPVHGPHRSVVLNFRPERNS
jgi:hypothetical protein